MFPQVKMLCVRAATTISSTVMKCSPAPRAPLFDTKNEDRPWTPTEAGSGTGHVDYKATWLMTPKQEHEHGAIGTFTHQCAL